MKKALLVIMIGFIGMSLLAQTQFEVSYKELPKNVQKYVQKNYDGWTIDKAVMGENTKEKMTFCDVYVSKAAEKLKLVFDKDGEFVKKEPVTQPAAAPVVAPVTKPAQQADTTKKKK
jgi:hypothetical protein